MCLNLLNGQPVGRVSLQETTEQVGGLLAEAWQDLDVLFCDTSENLMPALVTLHRLLLEWVDSTDHLVG